MVRNAKTNNPLAFGWYPWIVRGKWRGAYRRRWLRCFAVQYDIRRDCWDLWLVLPFRFRLRCHWWGLEPWHIALTEPDRH